MSSQKWAEFVVDATLAQAAGNERAQLFFLLQRLEACPDALPAIADAVDDLAQMNLRDADALRAEVRRRKGGAEIIQLQE